MQKRQNRGRLGDYLIEAGHLKVRDLERALEIQRVAGGHLGTNLLEMGVVTEEVLLEAIGRMHDNPTVSGQRLREIPKEITVKVPRDLVRRHNIVPFALHGNTVYIASQRPGDIHIENEVTLATSRLTRTFLGLEVRVQAALHQFHGHSLPVRFSRLIAKLDGKEPPIEGGPGSPAFSSDASPSIAKPSPHPSSSRQEDETEWISRKGDQFDPTLANSVSRKIVWTDFESDDTPAQGNSQLPEESREPASKQDAPEYKSEPGPAASKPEVNETKSDITGKSTQHPDLQQENEKYKFPLTGRTPRRSKQRLQRPRMRRPAEQSPTSLRVESQNLASVSSARKKAPASLVEAHAALLEASNRDAVGRILMEGLRPFFKRRLLLAKRGRNLLGWRADGPGIRPKNLTSLSFPLASGSPFLAIESGSRFWLSAYHQDAGYEAISSTIGPIQAPDCMILPLRAGEHIVGFLYGDNEEVTVTGQPLNHFLEFSEAAGESFERIIRRLKDSRENSSQKEPQSPGPQQEDPWLA